MASGRSARSTVGLITLIAALACGCSPILSTAAPAGTSQPAPPTAAPAGTSQPALPTVVITRLPPPPTRVSPTPFAASVPRAQGEVQLGEGRVLRIGTGLRSRPVWSSDGRFIAEPGTDGIHILDGATLEPLRHLFSPVRDRVIAVSPDGDLIISASMGSMAPVEVWNTRTAIGSGPWGRRHPPQRRRSALTDVSSRLTWFPASPYGTSRMASNSASFGEAPTATRSTSSSVRIVDISPSRRIVGSISGT